MAKTYEPISTTTLGANTTTVTISSIPSTYTDLVLVCDPAATSNGATVFFRMNGDTAGNYSWIELSGSGSAAAKGNASNATRIDFGSAIGVTNTLGTSMLMINIFNYASSAARKVVLGRLNNAAGASFPGTTLTVGSWRSTAAVTSISFTTNAAQQLSGATFTLYGIKAA